MSAEVLRRAASLMRERAEAVPPDGLADCWFDAEASDLMHLPRPDREHIASWHPAVALAVADWLDEQATYEDTYMGPYDGKPLAALRVATTYLGESA